MWNKLKIKWLIANKLSDFTYQLTNKLMNRYEYRINQNVSFILISNIELQQLRNQHYLFNDIKINDKQWNMILNDSLNKLISRTYVPPYNFAWCEEGLIMTRKNKQ